MTEAYARPEYLIEPAELSARIAKGDVRVFDGTVFLEPAERGYRARSGLAEYQQAHIPGSAFVDQLVELSDTSSGLGFTLPEAGELQQALGRIGAASDMDVVVYSSGHPMWATRFWWLLHYAGHNNVAVLNGGFAAWQAAGLPVTDGPASYAEGSFQGEVRRERFVDQQTVLAEIGSSSVCTVNALAPGVYTGESEMSYGRKGHITGSVNVFYDELLDDGRYRSAEDLKASLRAKGLLDAERVIAYCGGGISATIDALACLLVGQDQVAVYDGSMSEWVRDENLPMTLGEEPSAV
jgi:thiosulfate/3-mercaptopyruvate sulfurtransferase